MDNTLTYQYAGPTKETVLIKDGGNVLFNAAPGTSVWIEYGIDAVIASGAVAEPYTFEMPDQTEIAERMWRDGELAWCDIEQRKIDDLKLLQMEDSTVTDEVSLARYRMALRNYPQQPDFPNGERPSLQVTKDVKDV